MQFNQNTVTRYEYKISLLLPAMLSFESLENHFFSRSANDENKDTKRKEHLFCSINMWMELGACRKWRFFCALHVPIREIVCYGNMVTISDSFCMGNLRNYSVGAQRISILMSPGSWAWKLLAERFRFATKPQKFQPKKQKLFNIALSSIFLFFKSVKKLHNCYEQV